MYGISWYLTVPAYHRVVKFVKQSHRLEASRRMTFTPGYSTCGSRSRNQWAVPAFNLTYVHTNITP